jgi:hypothetical protein
MFILSIVSDVTYGFVDFSLVRYVAILNIFLFFFWSGSTLFGGRPLWLFVVGVSVK